MKWNSDRTSNIQDQYHYFTSLMFSLCIFLAMKFAIEKTDLHHVAKTTCMYAKRAYSNARVVLSSLVFNAKQAKVT